MGRAAGILAAAALAGCHDAATPAATSGVGSDEASGTDGSGADPSTDAASSGAPTGSSGDDGSTGAPPPEPVPGLFAEYFVDFHDAVFGEVQPGVAFDWQDGAPAPGVPADRFSVRWHGWLTAPSSGRWTLATDADDGVRIVVDGTVVLSDWVPHPVTHTEVALALQADVAVPITVEYFELGQSATVTLSWRAPGGELEPIPTSALTTLPSPSGLPGPKPPYLNPVVGFDCPDPGVLALPPGDAPQYAMVCTGGSFPIRSSRDLVAWSDTGVALLPAGQPAWAANGWRNWAPELHRQGDRLLAYFTSVDASDTLCIGALWADALQGPWQESPAPLLQDPLGVIDATWVHDGAQPWLVYKIDGNAVGAPTPILARALTDDGLAFAPGSSPTQLLVNDPGSWEGGVVEAPWLVQRDGQWFLFYSGNVYDHRYRTGVARAASLLGPYEKHGAPILGNNERWVGPGHGSVVTVGSFDYFVYHAWSNAGDGSHDAAAGRQVLVDRIAWQDGWPVIGDGTPSRSWQPWPGEP
ncbi:MAG: family 43 glycosylhydrolase [Nannocystaceae bacterium]|nr:family 43 glycosylhydrolase [Nannocystaceae bacterium]